MFKAALLLLTVVLISSSLGSAQTRSETGFVIVTAESGNLAPFTAVATLFNPTDIGVARAAVGPAPILTNAALTVQIGGAVESSSSIVLVNPSPNAATVNFALSNQFGGAISDRTISIAGKNQVSFFANDLFQIDSTTLSTALLKMNSNIAVAVLALDFRGVGFTSIPVTNIAALPAGASSTVAPAPPLTVVISPTTTPGSGLGVIGVTRPPSATVTGPASTATAGGPRTFIFPQVVTGGGAAVTITVGNSSTIVHVVRFDFFNSFGDLIRTISVPVLSDGFVVFSSESNG